MYTWVSWKEVLTLVDQTLIQKNTLVSSRFVSQIIRSYQRISHRDVFILFSLISTNSLSITVVDAGFECVAYRFVQPGCRCKGFKSAVVTNEIWQHVPQLKGSQLHAGFGRVKYTHPVVINGVEQEYIIKLSSIEVCNIVILSILV